jgi:serine/threonine protein kinase
MEYLHQSIDEHIQDKINGKNKIGIIDILLQMFDAIETLHKLGKVVHRDIKPDNFRMHDGKVKMIDFGLVTDYLDR